MVARTLGFCDYNNRGSDQPVDIEVSRPRYLGQQFSSETLRIMRVGSTYVVGLNSDGVKS